MGYRAALLNFSKGEIAPELESRFDTSAYQPGLRRATNVKIRRIGGVAKRMGTRFVSECLSTTAVRLLAFQFSDDQAYALELGQAYMRPAALGGVVLEEGLLVTAITKAVHAKITAAYHGYSVGDQAYLQDITGMVEINDRFLTILTVPDANNFTVDFDTTNAGTFTGSGGGTARVGAPPAPPPPPSVPAVLADPTPPDIGSSSAGGYDDTGKWTDWRNVGDGEIP
jgi:hypothetical protein